MLIALGGVPALDLIRARTGEGRGRARQRGVKLGRSPKLIQEQQREAIERRNEGEETRAEIARCYNVQPHRLLAITSSLCRFGRLYSRSLMANINPMARARALLSV